MQYSLIGFRQDMEFRVFAFEGTAADRTRREHTVRADMVLTRKYGIRVQELPLLCRELLERGGEAQQSCAVTFTEDEMRLYLNHCAAERSAALLKRKSTRKPHAEQPAGFIAVGGA